MVEEAKDPEDIEGLACGVRGHGNVRLHSTHVRVTWSTESLLKQHFDVEDEHTAVGGGGTPRTLSSPSRCCGDASCAKPVEL